MAINMKKKAKIPQHRKKKVNILWNMRKRAKTPENSEKKDRYL